MDLFKIIEKKIHDALHCVDVQIRNDSYKHIDHYNSPLISTIPLSSHINIMLICDFFINMTLIKRHRMIYDLLSEELNLIHALSLQIYTISEFELKKSQKNKHKSTHIHYTSN
ncbi:BolA family protein [Wolbachia endosymbiont of Howardula sp.]|uniref:BolA family protein n=1 Tax=Wolbachia endosymbiont of Howardula sp. TaxID=2916816 RepID=UPI00217CDC75|nr:BolA family protein [Wolbachia endosymbiont of Howardula sp.]UWI83124.1 BolA family transcriptional regulator [Wolbachia endosymbiont of Howardula sp.]